MISSKKPALRKARSDGVGGAKGSAKKMVIKPFKKQPKLPDDFEARTWEMLQTAVAAVHAATATTYSREELYRAVEDMCIHQMSARLYERLQGVCEAQVARIVGDLARQTPEVEAFLRVVQTTWESHCDQMVIIRSIFLYLDRTYVIHTASVRSLWDMGLQLFRRHLDAHPDVKRKVLAGLLELVERERQGETVDRTLVSVLLRMLSQLKLYEDQFEPAFLEATQRFYRAEGARYMDSTDVPNYMVHVERRFAEEQDRVAAYLDDATRRPLVAVLESQLLAVHATAMLAKGFAPLMDDVRVADLKRMYGLLVRVGKADEMRTCFLEYCKAKGLEAVKDPEKDPSMVETLLKLKDTLDTLLAQAFAGNDTFLHALKSAFETFINARENRPAELIAKFVDHKLRSGNKGQSEAEVEGLLDKVMVLFRAIHGKDVFEAFYKKDLAKRLLLNRSASFDLEKSMIAKLKAECGAQFTNHLEGMFKDVDVSKGLMSNFTSAHWTGRTPEVYVHVLTITCWPTYGALAVKLPMEMEEPQKAFTAFYNAKFKGRRLTWQHSLGHCVLKCQFPHGRKELSVSLYQALVLMLYNREVKDGEPDCFTYAQIKEGTGLDDEQCKATLVSLAMAKVRVLSKEPKTKDIKSTDEFHFNKDFKAKLMRLKINQVQIKETKKEQQETNEKVFRDRQYQVDAAIVRIMKTRKTLTHQLLLSELFAHLKFPVKASDLKKRIESLLDREYLERDEEDASVYRYLA